MEWLKKLIIGKDVMTMDGIVGIIVDVHFNQPNPIELRPIGIKRGNYLELFLDKFN